MWPAAWTGGGNGRATPGRRGAARDARWPVARKESTGFRGLRVEARAEVTIGAVNVAGARLVDATSVPLPPTPVPRHGGCRTTRPATHASVRS